MQPDRVGIVVIGRNEGLRLERCLRTAAAQARTIVYVDSGSTDGSIERARSLGAIVVALDTATPFTAARARNAGLEALRRLQPELAFVQFVDGDCELEPAWIGRAMAVMDADPQSAVVCGRRRERFPDASVYNRLADMEWDTPPGLVNACGGDALMRLAALDAVGAFRDDLIAGEEPELCVRLRLAGWTIRRIDAPMTLHDAAMTRFSQWWARAVRAGYAYANGAWLHGAGRSRHNARAVASILCWSLGVPAAVLPAVLWFGPLALGGLALYGLLWLRVRAHRIKHGNRPSHASLYASFVVLAKFAQLVGLSRFVIQALVLRRSPRLIEYKGPAESVPDPAPCREPLS